MSLGNIDEIGAYLNMNYKAHQTPFTIYNITHEFYRGYVAEVYTMKNRSLLAPVIQVLRVPPTNVRWFAGYYMPGSRCNSR